MIFIGTIYGAVDLGPVMLGADQKSRQGVLSQGIGPDTGKPISLSARMMRQFKSWAHTVYTKAVAKQEIMTWGN